MSDGGRTQKPGHPAPKTISGEKPNALPGDRRDPSEWTGSGRFNSIRRERADAATRIHRALAGSGKQAGGGKAIPRSGGASLEGSTRAKMEGALGSSLGDVKIHTGAESAEAASDLSARAFTTGSDVHFGAGEFAPGTKEGDRLIAHELTHVVQGQRAGVQRKAESAAADERGAREVSQPGDPAEREADAVADRVAGRLHGGARAQRGAPAVTAHAAPVVAAKLKPGTIYRDNKDGGVDPPVPSGPPLQQVLDSLKKKDEVAGIGDYDNAFRVLGGLSTTELITTLDGVQAAGELENLIGHQNSAAPFKGPRTITAMQVVKLAKSDPDKAATEVTSSTLPAEDQTPLLQYVQKNGGGTDKLKGTAAPTKGQKDDVDQIYNPTIPPGGVSPPFVAKGFDVEMMAALLKWKASQIKHAKELSGPKAVALDMTQVRAAGDASQQVVTKKYGGLVKGAAPSKGTSAIAPGYKISDPSVLHQQEETVDGPGVDKDDVALDLARYAAEQPDGGKDVGVKHNLDTSRAVDRAALEKVKQDFVKANKVDLLLIQKMWPGEKHGDGSVYVQTKVLPEKGLNKDQTLRKGYWAEFQTLIHEYLHSCAHGNFNKAAHKQTSTGYHINVEGGCDYFTEKVWNDVQPTIPGDDALRQKVEGAKYPYDAAVIPAPSYYDSKEDVKKLVAKMAPDGDANFTAAYFQGHTELIGLGNWDASLSDAEAYTVNGAMSLADVAKQTLVDEAKIASANGLVSGAALTAGQKLKVPGIRWHVAVPNDTAAIIAEQTGVVPAVLKQSNPSVTDWNKIPDGTKILIPAH